MLTTVILLIACSLALSTLLTPIVRGVALHWGLVDLPDNHRKVHRKPVPRVGGAAIVAAYFGSSLVVASFVRNRLDLSANFTLPKSFALAALLIFLVGLLDDVIGLKPWHKLAAEIMAGSVAVSSGICLGGTPVLSIHCVPAALCTILWLVLCTNAVNLIDGLDGLAAGIALLAGVSVLLASLLHGAFELAISVAPLIGALLGFLAFNFNPASIFLGDSGSLLIGFLLGCYSVLWSGKSGAFPKTAAPLIALAIPLTDTTLAIVRRFLRAKPIFSPDRSHVHHRLLTRGFSHRQAVLLLYLAAAIAGAFSVCLVAVGRFWEPVVIAMFVAALFLGVRRLGYAELETAGRILTFKAFQHEVHEQLSVHNFEDRLAAAASATDCWTVIREAAHEFGFRPIQMRLGGQFFVTKEESIPITLWTLRMPISQNEWIQLFHETGSADRSTAFISFAEAIRKVLSKREMNAAPSLRTKTVFAASAGALQRS